MQRSGQRVKKIGNNIAVGTKNLINLIFIKKTNMNKKLIRLTESDLHRIVKESVNRILRESIDPWEDAVYKHYTREKLPKGWERIDR